MDWSKACLDMDINRYYSTNKSETVVFIGILNHSKRCCFRTLLSGHWFKVWFLLPGNAIKHKSYIEGLESATGCRDKACYTFKICRQNLLQGEVITCD